MKGATIALVYARRVSKSLQGICRVELNQLRFTPSWQLSLSTTCNISTCGHSDSYYDKASTGNRFYTFATYGALRIAARVKTQATPDVTGGSHSADPH